MIAKRYEKPFVPMPVRDGAGSFDFKEGTGAITAMVSLGEFMELYKVDATMQVRTPESIDPDRTNPNAPWASTVSLRAGSANPIVSRLVIQSHEILKVVALPDHMDVETTIVYIHSIKETLLACESIALRITRDVTEIIDKINKNEIPRDNHGRGYNPFPHVADLVIDSNNFLIHANKIIRLISHMPSMFLQLKADNNFDHLSKTLGTVLPADHQLVAWIDAQSPSIRRIVDLRNFAEHSSQAKATRIEDFKIMPNGQVRVPSWGFEDADLMAIHEEMGVIVDYLLHIAEDMFIACVDSFKVDKYPLVLIRHKEMDKDKPIKYSYTIDISQFNFPT